jgi:hypothetical protein
MNLPIDLIAPAINAHVEAAVVQALNGHEALIKELVSKICGQLVNAEGKSDGWHCNTPWLTWAVQNIIKDAVKKSIEAHLSTNTERIQKAIDAEMKKSNSKLVQSLVDGMSSALARNFGDTYHMKILFENR